MLMNRKRMEVHFLIYWESSTEKKSGSFTLAKFSPFNISELIKYFLPRENSNSREREKDFLLQKYGKRALIREADLSFYY